MKRTNLGFVSAACTSLVLYACCSYSFAQLTKLTFDGRIKRDPVFRSAANEVVFTLENADTGQMQLARLNMTDHSVSPLDRDNHDSRREFAISADGAVHAYNTVQGLSSKIRIENTRTAQQVTLPGMGQASWANWPCLSPTGDRVLWVEGARVLYEYDLALDKGKASVRRLTPAGAPYSDYWPRYSPDGRRIVFGSNRDLDFEIYLMNADGTGQQRLTDSRGIDMHPVFSPDGNRIAFTSNRDGNYDIFIMNLNSRSVRRVTDHPERDDFACWLPSAREIVFVGERNGKTDLYKLDLETRPVTGTSRVNVDEHR